MLDRAGPSQPRRARYVHRPPEDGSGWAPQRKSPPWRSISQRRSALPPASTSSSMAATCCDGPRSKGFQHEQDRSERPLRRRHRWGAGVWARHRRALRAAQVAIWDHAFCRLRKRPPGNRPGGIGLQGRRVSDLAAVEKTRDETLKALGKIDILVNNAGIAGINRRCWETDLDEWRKVLRINLDGPFICCKAVVPAMLAAEIRPHRQHRLDRRQGRQPQRRALLGLEGRR